GSPSGRGSPPVVPPAVPPSGLRSGCLRRPDWCNPESHRRSAREECARAPALHAAREPPDRPAAARPELRRLVPPACARRRGCRRHSPVRLTLIFHTERTKLPPCNGSGQVAEWLKAPPWKGGIPARVSRVRIPPCPCR